VVHPDAYAVIGGIGNRVGGVPGYRCIVVAIGDHPDGSREWRDALPRRRTLPGCWIGLWLDFGFVTGPVAVNVLDRLSVVVYGTNCKIESPVYPPVT
jgi:hypothetical protein